MAVNRDSSRDWTLPVRDALARAIVIDPSILAHHTRGEFLESVRSGPVAGASLMVPYPVAHLWAMARVEPVKVHSYILSQQQQLPLLQQGSLPASLRAVADWIRREPWIHGPSGRSALLKSLTLLGGSSWDITTLEPLTNVTTAEELARLLARVSADQRAPVLSFSEVYRGSLLARGLTVIDAPQALAVALFSDLGLASSTTVPRLTVPSSLLGQPAPEVFCQLLKGAHVVFSWPERL